MFPRSLQYAARHLVKRNAWVLRACADLMTREFAPPEVHRARQEVLLGRLVHAARRIPAYARGAERAPERFPLERLAEKFPLIDKTALLQRPWDFFAGGRLPRLRWNVATTSGTTGTPLDVYRSVGSIVREETFQLQHWCWAGWRPGGRQAVLRGDLVVPIGRRKPPYWFHDAAGRQLMLSTRHLDRNTAPEFARALREYDATQLRAYPSAAYELARYTEESGEPLRFASVITGSEMLYDFQRARIESAFGARVYDFYGMAERVAFAAECERGRMHVNPEYGIIEIVDGDGRPTDGDGAIVGTSLLNTSAPLIRYRMNDMARWSREPCPCGRTYPVIEHISGRLADQLFDLDGRPVNCTIVGFAFDGMRNIRRAQVAQVAADRWVIRIVPAPGYSDEDGRQVLDKLAREVSARVQAQIEVTPHIPTLPNGKFRWVSQEYVRGSAPPAPTVRAPARLDVREAAC